MWGRIIAAAGFMLMGTLLHAQAPFGFIPDQSVPVFPGDNMPAYPHAWTGGLNAPQFGHIDLDLDGTADLLVFDRSGNKLLPFLREENRFSYAPQYTAAFPPVSHWIVLRDYDKDGRIDLFCSASNGIAVYRNTSANGHLSFSQTTPLLYSNYGSNVFNLYVSPVDYPAIDDVDGDGDLDIITFYILGTCVEYHRNLSQELSGHSDSLWFRLESDNWGRFTEDAQSNNVIFSDSCDRPGGGIRHAGSTLLIHDVDHDGDPDLLLGDVSYPELLVLINSRQGNTDIMTPLPEQYPEAYNGFNVPLFPAAFRLFITSNHRPDLVIAPNTDEQSLNKGDLCRVYPSVGGTFDFTGPMEIFLGNEMIDVGTGAYPAFSDLDNDGDQDLLVGNFGDFEPPAITGQSGVYRASVSLYENTGSDAAPRFVLRNDDLGGFRSRGLQHLAIAAADLTGDNRPDLVVATLNGEVQFLEQTGLPGSFGFEPRLSVGSGIQAGPFAVPALFDLDHDGLKDLITGNRPGYFNYYRNTGTTAIPAFPAEPTIARLGNIETIHEGVSNWGYSAPAFYTNGEAIWLFSGSESGNIYVWQIPGELSEPFVLLDSLVAGIDEGTWSSAAIHDLDNDGFPELITGNRRGGLTLYRGTGPLKSPAVSDRPALSLFPNPAADRIFIHGPVKKSRHTLIITSITGQLLYSGTINPQENPEIDIAFIPAGYYLVLLEDGSQVYSFKLIKTG